MSVKLSFCIPTYNRAAFIGETIESIISQATDEVEIVISDNASSDNTEELVRGYQQQFPRITYFRWNENMGADRNYLKVVELAAAKYCWLMGSDDVLKSGAIKRIMGEIKGGHDIYLCNRIECDIKLQEKSRSYWLHNQEKDRIFDLGEREDLIEYLGKARSLGAVFSYISSIIFNREKWNQVKYDEAFTGSAYAHVFMLMSFIGFSSKLKYICEPLVFCRGGNDSFMSQGIVGRFLLDINAYHLVADKLFHHDNELQFHFYKIMRYERPWWYIARIRASVNADSWGEIKKKLMKFNYGSHVFFVAEVFGCSELLMRMAVYVRRLLYNLR